MTVSPVVVAARYRLGEMLGRGGMGRVFLARDEVLDRDVAIKEIVLPEEVVGADREAVQQRTLREARAAARISHPNAAQVYDVIAADGTTWIVMEYVRSRSLQEVITADGPLEPHRVAEIGLAVLDALDAAHRAGVRHRDVKPANVLISDDGRVVLTDFGIATIEGDGIVTSSDMVLGSPQYMSPERVRNGTTLPASDLWSLGATLFTAVEGHSPYERASVIETLTAVAADEPEAAHRAGVLAPVLEGLLRKDPAERIDLDETRRLLQVALHGEPPARPRWPWGNRRNRDRAASTAAPAAPAAAPAARASTPAAPAVAPAAPAAAPAARAAAPAAPAVDPPAPKPDDEPARPTAVEAPASPSSVPASPSAAPAPPTAAPASSDAAPAEAQASPAVAPTSPAAASAEAPAATPAPAEAQASTPKPAEAQASTPKPAEAQASTPAPAEAQASGAAAAPPAAAPAKAPAAPKVPAGTPHDAPAPAQGSASARGSAPVAAPADAPARSAPLPAVVPRQRRPEGQTVTETDPADPDRAATPRRRRSLLAAGVAAVVLAGAGTTWYALREDGNGPSRTPPAAAPTGSVPAAPTGTVPGSGSGSSPGAAPGAPGGPGGPAAVPSGSAPAPSGSPATSPATGQAGTPVARPALPGGWRDYRDPTGFRVYVPKGWARSQRGSIVYFRDGKGRVLGIDQTNKPQPDPVADWRGKARYRVGAGDFPGYDQIKIVPVKYWQKAADWEFTFNGSNRRHVNNRGFITSKKQAYGIWWETSDSTWKADRDDLQLVFDSFRPKT